MGATQWGLQWLKVKNPAAPAVRREAEEDWRANAARRDAKFDVPRRSRQRR
jgi:hypothetical protein